MGTKIAFYKATSPHLKDAIQQWGVRLWSFGIYSHCELINDKGSDDPKHWLWYAATSYNPGVTAVRNINYHPENWDVFDLPENVDYTPAFDFMVNNLGKKYDWMGIWFSQLFNWGINNKEQYFCSEYNALALQETSLMRGDTTPAQSYSPNSLYRKLNKMGELTLWQK